MIRFIAGFIMLLSLTLFNPNLSGMPWAEAYEQATVVDGGTVSGKVRFSGSIPPPKIFELRKFLNSAYCGKISDGKGNRLLEEVRVGPEGFLRDAVIYIKDISKGKPMKFNGTDIKASTCQFLVQGGASTFSGVVMEGSQIRIHNDDSDPNDLSAVLGIRHNPQTDEITGKRVDLMFKKLLPNKGQVIKKKVVLKSKDSFVRLQCDIHDFMQTYFLPVNNPYYAIVKNDGTFTIEDVPPGGYNVLAWHPILGKQEAKIKVEKNGTVNVQFSFSP